MHARRSLSVKYLYQVILQLRSYGSQYWFLLPNFHNTFELSAVIEGLMHFVKTANENLKLMHLPSTAVTNCNQDAQIKPVT